MKALLGDMAISPYTIPSTVYSFVYAMISIFGYCCIGDYKRDRIPWLQKLISFYDILMVCFLAAQINFLSYVIGDGSSVGLYSDNTDRGELWVTIHALSRVLHSVDTLYILIRNDRGRMTYAHLFHNSTILIIWGLVLDNNSVMSMGTIRFTAMVHSLIYMFIYAYWSISTWGKCITPGSQIVTSFVIVCYNVLIIHSASAIYAAQDMETYSSHRTITYSLFLLHHIIMLCLVFPLIWKKRITRCCPTQREVTHRPTVGEDIEGI